MRKLLTAMLTVVAACCLTAGVACHSHSYSDEWTADETYHWHAATCKHEDEKSEVEEHTWVATGETDDNGYDVYKCSVCGYVHSHAFSSAWTSDKTGHWHASTCGHDEISGYDTHDFEDGVCTVCGFDETEATEYQILFAYYTDDDEDGEYGSDGDTYRGVTYTAVEYNGITVDVTGDYLFKGDVFAFTVKKSAFCSYTDSHDYPYVYANDDVVAPDSNGVYVVEVEGDTVITVGNVEQDDMTIGGAGTEDDPYTINSLVDWLYFANLINDKDWYGFSYNTAYWKLTCDLDFQGESIYVIGDGYTTDYSIFCGIFDGDGYTLSNFSLDNGVSGSDTEYSTYIGLFGIVSGYTGVDTCIKNLNVSNYTIEATAMSDSIVAAGGIIGYASGASVVNCHVDGLTITVAADDQYYSYAGGIVGVCQSSYSESEGLVFYSSIQYSSADVTISGTGALYGAGGIVGRTFPANEIASVYLFNNYSSGSYSGAARAGGIVGYMGRYTSVQNCYSTASVSSSSSDTSTVSGYEKTALDDRYSYAGGIAGYAENDTIISGCFYKGSELNSSAAAGSSYAMTGDIIAGYSAAGFEDYRAQALIYENMNNLSRSATVTNDVLKNIGWNEADWVFGDGYPTTNTASAEHKFTVTISVSGTETDKDVDSVYIPLSYWYIRESSESGSGISEYLTSASSSTSHTCGYYFDQACTIRVPDCYVPMGNITLYATYSDYSDIAGTYIIYSNGITATLILNSDATYSFEHDAVYLEGSYEYNGTYATLRDSYFSRLVSSATTTQQATYFTFWAEKNTDGDLIIYDCETTFEITSDFDSYGYTYLARLVSVNSPLVAVTESHASVAGKYYDSNYTFTFDIGYTGTATQSDGTKVFGFTYGYVNGSLVVERDNGTEYTATVSDGKITSLNNGSGTAVFTLTAYDDFEGTWEQSATINKKYTFDGMGTWTYYVDGVKTSTGSYTVNSRNEIQFTRDSVTVTVTLNTDGTLSVKESTGSVNVSYFAEGGYQGTWYTAAQLSGFYTMTLGGITSSGYGLLAISGSGISVSDLRYLNDNGTLYAYDGDTIYARLTYSSKDGTMAVELYDSSYEVYESALTFFLYDDFKGDWFTTISDGTNTIYKLTFNGMGAYNTSVVYETDEDGNPTYAIAAMAVSGSVTIYYNDSTTDTTATASYAKGTDGYTFTFNGVTYTISYDENNNIVSVSGGSSTATLIAGDSLYNVTYVDGDGYTYVFNGGGNLTSGGTVVINDGSDDLNYYYIIDSTTGVVTIYSDSIGGTAYATATPSVDGDGNITSYTFVKNSNTTSFLVSNAFTGEWAVYGGYVTFTVPDIAYYVDGSVVEMTIVYFDGSDSYDLTGYYDGSVVWFTFNFTTYYINDVYGVKILGYSYNSINDEDAMELYEPDGYCTTYKKDDDNKVILAGDSKGDGYGNARVMINGVSEAYYYTVDADGNITIYTVATTPVAVYTFNVTAGGSYSNGSENRELLEVTAA